MSAECSSFHAFNRHQQTHGTLGDYCRTVSDSLQLLSIESGICGSSNLESDSENSHDELGVGVPHPLGARYNKRDAFFGEESLKKLRRNRALNHQITKTQDGKQQSCVWCCRTKEHISGAKHSRLGHKTTHACSVCLVPLCSVHRFDDESCFKQWHCAVTLNNPCAHDAQAPTVQLNDNRAPPPSRKRSDHQDPPNRRSRVSRIQVQDRTVRQRRSSSN
jgi:hypothetical protein